MIDSKAPQDLSRIRQKIDDLDAELVSLLNKRAMLAQEAGASKGKTTKFRPSREASIMARVKKLNNGPLSDRTFEAVMREVISGCLNLEQNIKVSYLGPAGTYSEEAARARFGSMAQYVLSDSLENALHLAEKGEVDVAVLPIENSIEGSVSRTLDLLLESPLAICDEIQLPIHHQLLSKAKSLNQVKELLAHPQALAQCRLWLNRNLPNAKHVPVSSNGQAAKVAAGQDGCAAIASNRAAELYGLNVLAANIEDAASNKTRFVVVGSQQTSPSGNDKTSLVCSTQNQPGALLSLLRIFEENGVNMVKLESRPASTNKWEYIFYIDIDGHCDDSPVAKAINTLERKTSSLVKIIGSYPKAT
jgi:chorismate mutase / prephenate dehydratase